jgi:outer membrane protease
MTNSTGLSISRNDSLYTRLDYNSMDEDKGETALQNKGEADKVKSINTVCG